MEVTDNTKTLANALAEIDQLRQKLERAEAIIREAQEQDAIVEVKRHGKSGYYYFEELKPRAINKGMKLYASPVPAMPIQDGSLIKTMAADLIHLLQFAEIKTPTDSDLPQVEKLIERIKSEINKSEVKPS